MRWSDVDSRRGFRDAQHGSTYAETGWCAYPPAPSAAVPPCKVDSGWEDGTLFDVATALAPGISSPASSGRQEKIALQADAAEWWS